MHSSLVAIREGLPLGLAVIKFWNRDKFHGANAVKRRGDPTRVPIEKKESIRWLENLRQSTELLADPGAAQMNGQQPAGHVPEEREAKHQQTNSHVLDIQPSRPENWRHVNFSYLSRS
jgi:hypothetical protein